ncbi:kinase-like protein [Gonapodya prolifera JEL478]|uniref:Kinase-like protein n=1 Tax=Gonapodya prolifera (strain JEL478) TaxID=1344416 RepID=A0A139A2D3_GONPJ|nr:kinase-like protein [Gonapodya prolifera JEL478]|eukprot:KXS10922.1 kinase-like protein [Gonapodya prolifera JEL478]
MRGGTSSKPTQLPSPPATEDGSISPIPKLWEIRKEDLAFNPSDSSTHLGQGGFGSVCRGKWHKVFDVAVKIPQFSGLYTSEDFDHEASIWYYLKSSPHVLSLYGVCREGMLPVFVSPLLRGSITSYLASIESLVARRNAALNLLRDTASGMKFLHENSIIHTDLKPDNILVDHKGFGVITDFGFAKIRLKAALAAAAGSVTGERPGTVEYLPPERLLREETGDGDVSTQEGDVYAFGITIWVVWTLAKPYPELKNVRKAAAILDAICHNNLRPVLPKGCEMPPKLQYLMVQCWDGDPAKRPPFSQIYHVLKDLAPPSLPTLSELKAASEAGFIQSSTLNDVEQMLQLAAQYRNGSARQPQDLCVAAELYNKAAEYGSPEAQVQLAFFYQHGLGGMPRDLTVAADWLHRAAEKNSVEAKLRLGTLYYNGGAGVDKDWNRTAELFMQAADEGSVSAKNHLGYLYQKGMNDPSVLFRSAKLFQAPPTPIEENRKLEDVGRAGRSHMDTLRGERGLRAQSTF